MANQDGNTIPLVNVISVTVLPTPAILGNPLINTIAQEQASELLSGAADYF